MYTLKDNGIVEELPTGNNFGYILSNNGYFVNTDYKVLLSQTNDIFVQCMKMSINGRIELLYLTDEFVPMSSMLVGILPDTMITIILNLFAAIIEVKNNGFLTCQNIDLSWDKIFVDKNTLKVKLIYVPVNYKVFDSYPEFENELRSSLIKLIRAVIQNTTPRLEQFILDLANGSYNMNDLYNKSKGANLDVTPISRTTSTDMFDAGPGPVNSKSVNSGSLLKLVGVGLPMKVEIPINKDIITIGKKAELVDYPITFNKMISRKHCSIERIRGEIYIIDENSANGTYVNGFQIPGGQAQLIKKGDIIRLADSDFQLM